MSTIFSKEKVEEILDRSSKGEYASEIARHLKCSRSTVKNWIKKGRYIEYSNPTNKNNNYDFSLFEILNNTDFAKKYKISKQCAAQLRKSHAPHTNTNNLNNEFKKENKENFYKNLNQDILEYISKNKIIKINDFVIQMNVDGKNYTTKIANKEKFIQIANDNDIKISFFMISDYEHGYCCSYRHCDCEIFKLNNAIRSHFRRKKIKISTKLLDYFSNEFLQIYKEDQSFQRNDFYKMIDDKFRTIDLNKQIRPKNNKQ